MKSSGVGATPGKLILIAVLGVILVVVVAVQFGGKSDANEPQESESAAEARVPEPAAQASAANDDAAPERPQTMDVSRPWPDWKMADVLQHDPFATPELLVRRDGSPADAEREREAEAAARREEKARKKAEQDRFAEQLQKQGVRALVGSSRNGHAAIVGSETVRVGDVLGEFQVIAVGPDGVVLKRPELK
ncbi:MAG: hypothetical protein HQ582_32975 [Planctomycetes bacterium]|nr:hypothetical protein [Planctomycetota bacterium]